MRPSNSGGFVRAWIGGQSAPRLTTGFESTAMARVCEKPASPAPEPSASADTWFILLTLALAVVLVLHLLVDTILGALLAANLRSAP